MPIDRAAEKTSTPNVYKIDFPVKPGETRFDVTYSTTLDGTGTFAGKVLHGGGPVRFVAPAGVTLKSDSLRLLGQEPTTQASVFELKGADFTVQVEGTGSLQSTAGAAEEEEGAGMQQIRPSVYDRFYPVLGLALLILLIGFLLLYRRMTLAAAGSGPPPVSTKAAKGKRRE
jgi:hypothetical protein